MKTVAIYLGSATGNDPVFAETAYRLGALLASEGISIVYGGSGIGTMGALADGALSKGGDIVGIFPEGFKGKRLLYKRGVRIDRLDLTRLHIVKDFAERKKVMEESSDCAIALPGGYGTMDELFEYAVGNEIGRHTKPVFVLNVNGFYDGMKDMVGKMCKSGFLPENEPIIQFCDTVGELWDKIRIL